MNIAVELREAYKSFDGKSLFCNLNCYMQAPEFWWIEGESGAGKTTLFRIIMGLEQLTKGTRLVDKKIRFSAVFQEDRLCKWMNAVQNVELVCGKHISREVIQKHLNILLPEDTGRLPISSLSGGMKKRVALVRAILADSDVLILDEPFAGLDFHMIVKMAEYIKRNQKGRLILLSSHQGEDSLFSPLPVRHLFLMS